MEVDRQIFHPYDFSNLIVGRPILLYVGPLKDRQCLVEFCNLQLGDRSARIIIGTGPLKEDIEQGFDVIIVEPQPDSELGRWLSLADVVVFPGDVDTVIVEEAICCGTPVAAHPVPHIEKLIINEVTGYLSDNIEEAVKKCLDISTETVYNESITL